MYFNNKNETNIEHGIYIELTCKLHDVIVFIPYTMIFYQLCINYQCIKPLYGKTLCNCNSNISSTENKFILVNHRAIPGRGANFNPLKTICFCYNTQFS